MPAVPPVPNPFAPSVSNHQGWPLSSLFSSSSSSACTKGGGSAKARKAASTMSNPNNNSNNNNNNNNNNNCDCGGHSAAPPPPVHDTDTNKYSKAPRRQRNNQQKMSTAMRNFVGVCLIVLFSVSVTMISFGCMYLIARFQTDSDQDEAWERFRRAKTLLRLRNMQRQPGAGSGTENSPKSSASKSSSWSQLFDRAASGGTVDAEQAAALQEAKETDLKTVSMQTILNLFDRLRPKDTTQRLNFEIKNAVTPLLREWANRLDRTMHDNTAGGIRWIRPSLLPPLDGTTQELVASPGHRKDEEPSIFYKVHRETEEPAQWKWKHEWNEILNKQQQQQQQQALGPPVDYTQDHWYEYPPLLSEPPAQGGYPATTTLADLMHHWPQNQDISADTKIHETLLHFNYSNPSERATAQRFRDAHLPFKLYDIPDITRVTLLWTDDYVSKQFDDTSLFTSFVQKADGVCQESPDHFFAFFVPPLWQAATMGLPPVRNNDLKFDEWAQHARYADAKPLRADQPHFYWQAGTPKNERFQTKQSFITRDLNTTLGSSENNFFVFSIKEQKGIQCRFGERGVAAATHYDAGQNMIAMLTGAKRYILSPPKACSQLGLFTTRESPIFRHSLLNFAHLNDLELDKVDAEGNTMSSQERQWLLRAAQAPALETVLRAGQVLFLPSFWFHYIVSIQKSAQCNVRSGIETRGTKEFGGLSDIEQCGGSIA